MNRPDIRPDTEYEQAWYLVWYPAWYRIWTGHISGHILNMNRPDIEPDTEYEQAWYPVGYRIWTGLTSSRILEIKKVKARYTFGSIIEYPCYFFYLGAQYDNTDAAINFHICHGKAKQGDIWIENIDKSYMKNLEDYIYYCMSEKSWPILYSELLYKMGQDFMNIQ